MKLFQQLLVAPAALGLMAPVAATAAELNINDISEYSSPAEVQGINQFSDVYPTDWAYQALINLAERHGCVASAPNGSMTRYEAAALLNKCLGNVAQVNEEERRLLNEFGPELAVIKGRLDGLEARVGEFEAGVFSTTTKLSGSTTFVVGGVDDGDQAENDAVTFSYKTDIYLDSSFSGEDLLRTRIRTGNFTASQPFSSDGSIENGATLEVANTNANALNVDRAYYQFPLRENFTATVGALVRQDDMLGVWPSAYPSDAILDVLTYAGASATYSLSSGAGAGVTYAKDQWSASALFVSEEANSSANATNAGAGGGLLTAQGSDDVTFQTAWSDDRFTLAAAYTIADNGNTTGAADVNNYTSWGLSGVYNVDEDFDSEWLPTTVSYGMGWKSPDKKDNPDTSSNSVEDETTWTLGLIWNDAFVDGNNLGYAIGTADGDTGTAGTQGHKDDNGYDDPLAWEVFYQISVSDNITVTPAIFSVARDGDEFSDVTGALVKTTFSF